MTFLEELTAHKGRLILLKTELYWYNGRGWDGARGRVCLLMDSAARAEALSEEKFEADYRAVAVAVHAVAHLGGAATLLLIDGCPHWVWVSSDDLELL
jgi:hypothetical protein